MFGSLGLSNSCLGGRVKCEYLAITEKILKHTKTGLSAQARQTSPSLHATFLMSFHRLPGLV